MRQAAPSVRHSVREAASDTLLDDLLRGKVEVVIARLGPDTYDKAFRTQLLAEEPMCLVCGPQHPLARKTSIQWSDVLHYPWILPIQGTPVRERLGELLH